MIRALVAAAGVLLTMLSSCGSADPPSVEIGRCGGASRELAAHTTAIVPPQVYVGVLIPDVAVDVAAPSVTKLVAVLVQVGDVVEAGQSLAVLDARTIREELAMTRAELRRREAAVAEAVLDLAERSATAGRVDRLAAQGHASAEEVETAEFAVRRAQSVRASARAETAETLARIDRLSRQLADTSLRAPFAGAVAARHLDAGSVSGPTAPVVRIVGTRTLCRFAVPPTEAESFTAGRRVRLRATPVGDWIPAAVVGRAPQVDSAAHLVFIDADLDPEHTARLPMGSAVEVEPR